MDPLRQAHPARIVVDDAGVAWIVSEARALPHQRRQLAQALHWRVRGWLVFRNRQGDERRVPLPPRWRSITDTALRALLAASDPAPTR